METIETPIRSIKIGDRFRKEMGDLESLGQSIRDGGLLQPIGITPEYELVYGERRLRACRDILGRETISARIIDVKSVFFGQIHENSLRKDFTVSERIAIVDSLRGFRHGGDRRSDQARNSQLGSLSLADACKLVGLSEDSFRRATEVEEKGIPELVQAVDSGTFSLHAAQTLAQASREEQLECLTRPLDEGRVTAAALQKQLRQIRSRSEYKPDAVTIQVCPSQKLEQATLNSVIHGDCRDVISSLPDDSISLGLVSPPYAQQRDGLYPGVPEDQYPDFTVQWMSQLWSKLTDDGSVLIVIDPHVREGELADYVLRTQLALRDAGWKQHMPLIWLKEDRCPLGHRGWLRHSYEQILWFSKTGKPFCDPKAGGVETVVESPRYRHSRWSPGGRLTRGIKRASDVINVPVGRTPKGIDHPAMFPVELAEKLIQHFCRPGGAVWDGFAGSGNSLIAAARLGHPFYGCDVVPKYVEIATQRLDRIRPMPLAG